MGKKSYIIGIGAIVLIGILFFALRSNKAASFETLANFNGDIKIYKSLSCGCCNIYANYFQRKGNSNTEIVNLQGQELAMLKEQYQIPKQLESCHTTIIGDYFVEGHVPLEAIERLLLEKPDIKGIAMPGMPSGAPGMPGVKGEFIIYAVNNERYEEWMRL